MAYFVIDKRQKCQNNLKIKDMTQYTDDANSFLHKDFKTEYRYLSNTDKKDLSSYLLDRMQEVEARIKGFYIERYEYINSLIN